MYVIRIEIVISIVILRFGKGSRRTLQRVPEMMDTPPIQNNYAFSIYNDKHQRKESNPPVVLYLCPAACHGFLILLSPDRPSAIVAGLSPAVVPVCAYQGKR